MLEGAEGERGGKALLRFAEARDLFENDQRWKVRAARLSVDHVINCVTVGSSPKGQQILEANPQPRVYPLAVFI